MPRHSLSLRVSMVHLVKQAALERQLFTWLSKRMKKTKGAILPSIMAQAFEKMKGWSIREVQTPYIPNSGDFWGLPSSQYAPSYAPYVFIDEDAQRLEEFRKKILGRATVLSGKQKPPPIAQKPLLHLYITAPSTVSQMDFRDAFEFEIAKAWVVVPGWEVKAPNGETAVFPRKLISSGRLEPESEVTSDSFWKWAYKHGLDVASKDLLAREDAQGVEKAEATAEERRVIEQRRTFVPAIEKLFLRITEDTKQSLIASLTKMLQGKFETMLKWYQENPPWSARRRDPFQQDALFRDQTLRIDYAKKVVEAKPTAQDAIAKMAEQHAQSIQRNFVHKNTFKLSTIVSEKGLSLMREPKILRIEAGSFSLEGDIQFTFKDKSSFIVRNKVVWKMSALGTEFAQYPTTFHNVVLPSGKPMPTPSEKRMLDVFAKA